MSVAARDPTSTRGDLFGHPRGLAYLFATEMWERFSYYGMRALLTLYMVKYLLLPDRIDHVWGEPALRSGLEALFGPLGVQPFASQIYGLYTSLVYFTPILGGLIADRVLGQRRTVIIGAALMAIGHFLMASERLFLLALIVLVLGNGAFKPNISTQVGALYPPGDPRRDRAFSIFYVGINIGAFFSPLVCGTLAVAFGWHYGFAAAGIGMLIGLAIYLKARSVLPADERERQRGQPRHPLTREERRRLLALAVLFVPVTLFWATYEQQGNTIALWAEDYTIRSFDLGFWRRTGPALPVVPTDLGQERLYHRRGKIHDDAFDSYPENQHGDIFGYFVIVTLGELYLSPTGLSLVTKVAPARYLSMTMGVWLATSFLGNFIAGWLGSFWTGMAKGDFFLMIAAIAAAAAAVIFACNRPLRSALKD